MPRTSRPQSDYDDIKTKFKKERDKRLTYRPPGTTQYTSELTGELEKYSTDPWRKEAADRERANTGITCTVWLAVRSSRQSEVEMWNG